MQLRNLVISSALLLAGLNLWGQNVSRADSLMRECRFEEALQEYLLCDGEDQKTMKAQNAVYLTGYCARPSVVARKQLSLTDFYLYYPLKNQAWRESREGPVYVPKGAREIYYSAKDKAGTKSLFVTREQDGRWAAPRFLGESLLSAGNEIYPMVSADGNTLYFASDGLFGLGGYDIYSSTWNQEEGRWGDPVNMGFPFNSPADDFLMADSEDGKFTVFASNRDCGKDSVYVYVVDFKRNPQREAIQDAETLKDLLKLNPKAPAKKETKRSNSVMERYMAKMEESRALMDSISRHLSVPGDTLLPVFRAKLIEVSAELRDVEMSFLMSGAETVTEEPEDAPLAYTFTKGAHGVSWQLPEAKSTAVASYRVAPIGRFAQDNTLPPGLVYQIFLFESPTHAGLDDIKGLEPVFEKLGSNLRYGYYVGLFPTYDNALAELNVIRRLGFPTARIVAWRDGVKVF